MTRRLLDATAAAAAFPWVVLHVVSGAVLDVLVGAEQPPPYAVSPTTGEPTA